MENENGYGAIPKSAADLSEVFSQVLNENYKLKDVVAHRIEELRRERNVAFFDYTKE